jgi:hypothetical protein
MPTWLLIPGRDGEDQFLDFTTLELTDVQPENFFILWHEPPTEQAEDQSIQEDLVEEQAEGEVEVIGDVEMREEDEEEDKGSVIFAGEYFPSTSSSPASPEPE